MPARRILLLAIIALLLVYNLWHFNHTRKASEPAPAPEASVVSNNLWNDYIQAASVRDASDEQFQNALTNLTNARDNVRNPNLKSNAELLADIRGCTTWLLFYRQTVNKPHPDPAWRERSLAHIQSCSQNHADRTPH